MILVVNSVPVSYIIIHSQLSYKCPVALAIAVDRIESVVAILGSYWSYYQ